MAFQSMRSSLCGQLGRFSLRRVIVPVAILASLVLAGNNCGESSLTSRSSELPASSAASSAPSAALSPTAAQQQAKQSSLATPGEQNTPTKPGTSATDQDPARQLLAKLSLRHKAAQVLLASFSGNAANSYLSELLETGPPGGLLLLESNIVDQTQLAELLSYAQDTAREATGAGLLVAVDQEGGPVVRLRQGAPSVPAARVVGEKYSLLEAARLAEDTAKALGAVGININLAPVADVVSDPKSFLYQRTYSGDPTIVARYVRAITEGYRKGGLATVVKHFPGHGCAPGDTHSMAVVSTSSQSEFATIHFPPFMAAIEAGTDGIMMAHVVATAYDNEHPASLSPTLVNTVLREGLGFAGVVVADDLEMAAVAWGQQAAEVGSSKSSVRTPDPAQTAVAALLAGCDLLISTGTLDRQLSIIDGIVEAIASGDLPQERLDEAVLRILRLKMNFGVIVR